MTQASQEIARQYANASVNKKNWGAIAYNVLSEGLSGDGVTDDTARLQALINKAISEGRKTILFPHGSYHVTSLTNADKVEFVGDSSKFVGGYSGTIDDLGGFAALKAEATQKFSEVDLDIMGVQTNKADKTEVNTLASEKADITYVNSQISAIGNGSPKGAYATLTALQAAFPTGTTGIYIVNAGGNWYYWNGSAWTSGGIYQSTGLANEGITADKYADKSVKGFKTDFLDQKVNLFNKNDLIIGGYYQADGVWVANASFNSLNFAKVSPTSTYYTNIAYKGNLTYWDVNKNFISGLTTGWTSPISTPSNAHYMVMSLQAGSNLEAVMLCKNSLPSTYVPYGYTLGDTLDLSARNLAELDMRWESNLDSHSVKTLITRNIFNPATVRTGYEVYPTGAIPAETNSAVSEYIDVTDSTSIYISGLPTFTGLDRYAFFYNASKAPIEPFKRIPQTNTEATFTVPLGAKYFVMTIYQRKTSSEVVDMSAIQVEAGSEKTAHVPFKIGISQINGLPIIPDTEYYRKTAGKNLLLFGDSITETATVSDDGASYTEGVRSNWPKYAKIALKFGQVWNYAKSGAAYKDQGALPRQKISHQITTAIANNRPGDIIVVSAGTNDGDTNLGDYATAMGKATLGALDRLKLYEAIRWAFWTIRLNYPNAVCFAATPLQRADREPLTALTNAIKQMAQRYNFIVIDAESESGIVKDFEVWPSSGRYLSDGLHPNVAGQQVMANLYSRVIINALNY